MFDIQTEWLSREIHELLEVLSDKETFINRNFRGTTLTVSGITKGGAGREATDKEITGATYADGFGTALAGLFGGFPDALPILT